MFATMSDAHAEWHRNAGVPMGTPGCPQDACHPVDPYCWDCGDDDPNCECVAGAVSETGTDDSEDWSPFSSWGVDGTPF